MEQEQIASFMEITGCADVNDARHFLELGRNNLEQSINQYFSRKSRKQANYTDVEAGPSSSRYVPKYSVKPNGSIDVSTINLSDDDEPNWAGSTVNEDGTRTRAPIAPIRGPIVEQSFRESNERSIRRRQPNSVFNQFEDFRQVADKQDEELMKRSLMAKNGKVDYTRNSNNHRLSRPNNHSRSDNEVQMVKPRRDLSTLFRPPIEIMHKGDWDSAMREAKRRGYWLLVNIQKAEEFACQVLNRDIWSDRTVREILKSNFVFWQTHHDSPDGARVCAYYGVRSFPSIFAVDARTGEEVIKMRAPDSVSFLDQVTAFLEKYPTVESRDSLLSAGTNGSSKQSELSSSTTKRKALQKNRSSGEVVENAANVQAKRMKRVVVISGTNDEDDDDIIEVPKEKDDHVLTAEDWKNHIGEEGESNWRVKLLFRSPTGLKEQISVWNSTKLKTLFMYIASLGFDPKQHLLVLSFPKRVFSIKEQEMTCEEAQFAAQEVIHVEKI